MCYWFVNITSWPVSVFLLKLILRFATCLRLRLDDATWNDVWTASTILNDGWAFSITTVWPMLRWAKQIWEGRESWRGWQSLERIGSSTSWKSVPSGALQSKCICPNWQIYLFKFTNIFVHKRIASWKSVPSGALQSKSTIEPWYIWRKPQEYWVSIIAKLSLQLPLAE